MSRATLRAMLLWITLFSLSAVAPPIYAQTFLLGNTTLNTPVPGNVYVGVDAAPPDQTINTSPFIRLVAGGEVGNYLRAYNNSSIEMTGGRVGFVLAGYDNSTIHFSGGDVYLDVRAYDNATVNMSGGNILTYDIVAYGNSVINLTGGNINSSLYANDTSTYNIRGGTVNKNITAYNSNTINISGGSIGGHLDIEESSVVNLSGGTIGEYAHFGWNSTGHLSGGSIGDALWAADNSEVVWSGGSVGGEVHVRDDSRLTLFGSNLSYELLEPNGGSGYTSIYRLSGSLLDGTNITGKILNRDNNGTADFRLYNVALYAGPDQEIVIANINAPPATTVPVTLSGGASGFPEEANIAYEWFEGETSLGSGSTVTLNRPVGEYDFTLKVTSYRYPGVSLTDSVHVSITRPNKTPTANPQSVTTNQNTPRAITLTGSDPDGDPLTYTIAAPPSRGTLSGTAPNLIYTPNAGYSGADSFRFTVRDPYGATSTATVSINVVPVSKIVVTTRSIRRLGPVVIVQVRLTNAGSARETNVRVTSSSLIGVNAALIAPILPFSLNAGRSQDVTLVFFSLRQGQRGNLNVRGSSSVGVFSLIQEVTIP